MDRATGLLRSSCIGRDNDHTRMFRQVHRRIEGTYQSVLHHTRHGNWPAAPAEAGFHRQRGRLGRQPGVWQPWLGGDLLVARSTFGTSLVDFWGSSESLSVSRDNEDGRFAQFSEDVRDLVILVVISPDHPDPAARRCRREHLEGTVSRS